MPDDRRSGMSGGRITVVGIGADGWEGLTEPARRALLGADEIIGSERQLAGLPATAPPQRSWPSPIEPLIREILEREAGTICVLASGDPMHYGIGATLARRLGPDAVAAGRLDVMPHPSAASLVWARLGWSAVGVELFSAVGRPLDGLRRLLQPGRRIIVYVAGPRGVPDVAAVLVAAGFGASRLWVLERLGASTERVTATTAATAEPGPHDPLSTVAVEVVADPGTRFLPRTPGLADSAYASDGQLTKRHVRAATLAALAPAPGQLLWDLGAGSGSIAIEWLRAEPTAAAVAVERDRERATRISANAAALGTPGLEVRTAAVGEVLAELPGPPSAVFVGGGLSVTIVDRVWAALAPGGRLVANAVTLEAERVLIDAAGRVGGELIRLSVAYAEPLGGLTGWRPAREIVQLAAWKPSP